MKIAVIASFVGFAAPAVAQSAECGKTGGIVYTNAVARQSLDPAVSVHPDYQRNWLYDPVIRLTQDLEYLPWLVEEMPRESGENAYSFRLREGITFHDGTALDAEAVKFAIDRIANGDVVSAFTGEWAANLDEVVVKNDREFEIRLKGAWPKFMFALATSTHVPSPTAVREQGESFGVDVAVGSGPFKLKSFRPREYLEVERNDDYFMEGMPCLDGIASTHVTSGSVRSLAIQSDEMQVLNTFPEAVVQELRDHPDVQVQEGENSTLTVLLTDTADAALGDVRVRRAIQYAVSGQQMIDVVYAGTGGLISGIFPAWHPAYIEMADTSMIRPDLEKARALIEEAGYGPANPLTLTLITAPGGAHVDRGILAQADLAQIGVTLEVESIPNTAYIQRLGARDFDLALYQYDGGPGLADYTWTLFGADSGGNLTGYNRDGFANPRAEELAQAIAAAADPAAVADEIAEFQSLIFADLPMIFLNYRNHRTAWRNEVKNFSTAKLKGMEDWYQVWLDE
jgi:peptide/nickel transport system substrate-binding protein